MRVVVEIFWSNDTDQWEVGRVFQGHTPLQCADGYYVELLAATPDPARFEVWSEDDGTTFTVFDNQEGMPLRYFAEREVTCRLTS